MLKLLAYLAAPAAMVLLAFSLPLAAGESPSFDCAKASTAVETAVCASDALMSQDRLMAELFKKAAVSAFGFGPSSQRSVQRDWLKSLPECMAAKDIQDCLLESYKDRNKELAFALLMKEPDKALATLRQVAPEQAPLAEAIAIYAAEPDGADWSKPSFAGKRARLLPLITSLFRDFEADETIAKPEDVMASPENFAAFLQQGFNVPHDTLPCAAVLAHPKLLAATQAAFGSSMDSQIIRTDCAATLPPLPELDRLAEQINTAWPECDGSIRFGYYRSFEFAVDQARTGLTGPPEFFDLPEGEKVPAPDLQGVSAKAIKQAQAELKDYYIRYRKLSPAKAEADARGAITAILVTGQRCG